MDLFDLVDNPQAGQSAEKKPFNWEEFKAGKPAISRSGEIAYFGGEYIHPMASKYRFIAIMTVPDHAVIKYGKETMPYVIDNRGYFEGMAPMLVEMA